MSHSHDIEKGAEYLYIIFGSIFFVSLGILVDISAMSQATVVFLIVLTVVAVLTKLAGCSIPARIMGYSGRDSLAIGFGMSPRGEVAMIVALMGITMGLIGQEIYAAIVLMSLITTILTPILFRNWLFKKEVTACYLENK